MNDLIRKNFGLESSRVTEEELRVWLENRIAHMLEHETDLLLSTLYRLDIDELKIREVLETGGSLSIAGGLAELVLERQRQRQATKQSYRVDRETFYWGEEE